MNENNITYDKMANDLNITKSTFYTWFKYDRIPPADFACKISEIVDIDIYILLYGKVNGDNEKEELKKKICKRLDKMSAYELKLMLNLASGIIKVDKNEEAGQ